MRVQVEDRTVIEKNDLVCSVDINTEVNMSIKIKK
jgi:hypothetical protein